MVRFSGDDDYLWDEVQRNREAIEAKLALAMAVVEAARRAPFLSDHKHCSDESCWHVRIAEAITAYDKAEHEG